MEEIIRKKELVECPYERTINLIGNKWTLIIIKTFYLLDRFEDTHFIRFNELLKKLSPISAKTLSSKLKILAEQEIISRKVFDEFPVKIRYSLTEKGKDLNEIMDKMAEWSIKWNYKDIT